MCKVEQKWKVEKFKTSLIFQNAFPCTLQGLFQFLKQVFSRAFFFPFSFNFIVNRRASRWGGRRSLPCLFLKIEKKYSDLGKNALTVRIYRLSSSFNLSFSILRVLIPIILYILTKSIINSQFASYSHQQCYSFMLQYFSMEKRAARNSRRERS